MRRLPVYLLLDTSGSMHGEPIEATKNGFDTLVATLRRDPQALETAFLSLITFDSDARQVVPLTELTAIQKPTLNASGLTALGKGLRVLRECITREVRKTTADSKGDWKPMIFIMSDGGPTDEWQNELAEFHKIGAGMVVACAVGQNADEDVLRKLTENVVRLENTDSASLSAFFKWVSASIAVSSKRIETGGNDVKSLSDLPPPPAEINPVL